MLKKLRVAWLMMRVEDLRKGIKMAYEDINWMEMEARRLEKKIGRIERGDGKCVREYKRELKKALER